MTATLTRAIPRETDFVHLNVRLPRMQADWLRTCADASYLDVSKEVRKLITVAMDADAEARAA